MDDIVNVTGMRRYDKMMYEYGDNCSFTRENLFVFVFILGFALVFVLFANSLIMISVLKYPHMRRAAYILVANLSVSNNLLVLNFLFGIIERFSNLTSEERKYICMSKLAVFLASFIGSEYNLLLISIERFFAILFPFWHKIVIVKTRLWTTIAVVWVLYITFGSLPLLGWNKYREGTFCYMKDVWSVSYLVAICVIVFIGFILNIVFFVIVLYKIKCQRLQQPTRGHKTTWVSFCILFGFVICWCPFLVNILITSVGGNHITSVPCAYVSILLVGTTNGLINWLIYGLCNARFRQTFRAILLCQNLAGNPLYRSST